MDVVIISPPCNTACSQVHEALEGLFQRIYTHDKRLWVEEQQELEQEQQTFEQEAAMKREEIRTRKLP
jgi:hypothetical protein